MNIREPRRTYGMIDRDGRAIMRVGTMGDALAAYNAYGCHGLRVTDVVVGEDSDYPSMDWPTFVALSRAVKL